MPDYSNKRFLIADDEPFMLGLVDRMLKHCRAGLILKTTDGGTALRAIKDNFTQVDCIISDCNMKPINGLQLLQAVRVGINPRIPRDQGFIMLTGFGETEIVKAAIALDVNGYVVKPVAPEKLIDNIEKVFKRTIEVKDPEHYRAVKLPVVQSSFGNDDDGRHTPWTVMPKGSPYKNPEAMKAKIEQFKRDHATTEGTEGNIKFKNKHECSLDELKDGHVIAQDVEAEEGVILVRRGTTLTKDMIVRLRDLAVETSPSQMVWIGELVR